MSPITIIQRDLIKIAEMAISGARTSPDFEQKRIERNVLKILTKYKVRKRNQPKTYSL